MITFLRRRTDPERVEAYTVWSLIGSFILVPPLGFVTVAAVDGLAAENLAWSASYLVTLAGQMILGLVLCMRGIRQLRDGVAVSRMLIAAMVVLSLVAAGLALTFPPGSGLQGRGGAMILGFGICLMALGTVLPVRFLVAGALLAGVVVALMAWASLPEVPDPAVRQLQPIPAFITTAGVLLAISSSFRFSVWLLAVVWELDRTRTAHARLAVAEERLRFSRDLHDVVGRALSAVAVKSELASALAARGQDGAVEQMGEVRDLAQETLKEVRGVVAGYRAADLGAEIDGARSVLRSAGTEVEIIGAEHGAGLPQVVQEALAWVVREAVTNVVRHAAAARCTIDLRIDQPGAVRLTVTNDGVGHAPRGRGGSGLAGLRERLAPLGGDVETALEGEKYTLTALVPFTAPGPGQDEDSGTSSIERDPS